jgi:hypothetical protein
MAIAWVALKAAAGAAAIVLAAFFDATAGAAASAFLATAGAAALRGVDAADADTASRAIRRTAERRDMV